MTECLKIVHFTGNFSYLSNSMLLRGLILQRQSTIFLITSRIYANPHLLCTILERDMISTCIFPNCVYNVRLKALSDSVKFSRRLMQKSLDLLSCDLTTSKDQSYRAESEC